MKHLIFIGSFLILLFISFSSCGNSKNTISNKSTTSLEKNKPIDWADTLQKSTSFKEETQLLENLIQIDSTNQYEQLIANRLQTFDLRHLKEKEKLVILGLYEASLLPAKQPTNTTLQIAHAKLKNAHPTKSDLANEKIVKLLALIEKQAGGNLE